MRIKRINIFGGACSGKSTNAAKLFADLKMLGYNLEQIQEYIKVWSWIGRIPKSFDQVYTFAKQLHKEDRMLYSGNDFIITDSPLILSMLYTQNEIIRNNLKSIIDEFEKTYPSLNILLDRKDLPYKNEGRFHNKENAIEIDNKIEQFLVKENIEFYKMESTNYQEIFGLVLKTLEEK